MDAAATAMRRPPPKSFHIRLYLWSKTSKLALGIQVPKSPVPSSSLWTAVYLYLPNALNPSAVSKWSKQCWWKNLVTKGEWGQLRRRRTTQDTATDIWHLAKHPLNIICRPGTGKVFDFGMLGGRCGDGEETYAEAEIKKIWWEQHKRANPMVTQKISKCHSGGVARLFFTWTGSV